MKLDKEFFGKIGERINSKYPYYYEGEFVKGIPYLYLYIPVRLRLINKQLIFN